MAVRSITREERVVFATDGVVCLRRALDPAVVDAMAPAVERALASRATVDLTAMVAGLEDAGMTVERTGAAGGRFASGIDHWREDAAFAGFACTSDLPRIVAALLDSTRLWLYEDSVLVKEPGAAERTAWHQDLGYFHVDGERLATTWCPLEPGDARVRGGAVRARGRITGTCGTRPNLFVSTASIPGTEGDIVPDIDALAATGRCEIVTFTTAPGDVVVHHARTLHAAGPNTSAVARRRAISVRYCGDDTLTHLRPGAPRKPHQERWTDGVALDPAEHPQVWPPGAGT